MSNEPKTVFMCNPDESLGMDEDDNDKGVRMSVRLNTQRKGVSIVWDEVGEGHPERVTVFATGEEGDVHNKAEQPNNGEAGLFYPADFVGTSEVEVRANGEVVSSGTIEIA